ncbi:MAG: serine/threonine protein kinase [Gordonia sp. (in: high G+C Gram-positive bacteria)]
MTRTDIRDQPVAWPSCALGGWAAAWVAGTCAPDDVITALGESAEHHVIDDHCGTVDTGPGGVLDLLGVLRDADQLVVRLPAAGDAAGLPPGAATTAAFAAGEVLLVSDGQAQAGSCGPLALIPTIVGHSQWSTHADLICRWAVHRYPDPVDLGTLASGGPTAADIEYQLRQAIRDAAALFSEHRNTAKSFSPGDLRGRLAALTLRHEVTLPPSTTDTRTTRMIASAAQIEAIVELAVTERVELGAAAAHQATVDEEFRRLCVLARGARAAAVNATIAELLRPRR